MLFKFFFLTLRLRPLAPLGLVEILVKSASVLQERYRKCSVDEYKLSTFLAADALKLYNILRHCCCKYAPCAHNKFAKKSCSREKNL